MNSFARRVSLLLAGIALCTFARADTTDAAPTPPLRPLANATLAPALRDVAEHANLPLFQSAALSEKPFAGDAVVVWIGATRGTNSQQWLLRLTRGVATPIEQQAHRQKEITKYVSWGPVVSFKSEVDALDVWIAGPVDTTARAEDQTQPQPTVSIRKTRLFVAGDFLRLGLDKSERISSSIVSRSQQIAAEDPSFTLGNLYSLDQPIRAEKIGHAQPVAQRLGLTPEMARSWIGGYVALEAFYNLANGVPELKEIAEIACEKPSVLKLARLAFGTRLHTSFGGANLAPVDSGKVGLLPIPMESYDTPFGFQLGKDPIVHGVMLVTNPSPPLDVSAGILALIAGHPTDKTRAVELRIIGSSRGTDSSRETAELASP
jgi:hypothetical protein